MELNYYTLRILHSVEMFRFYVKSTIPKFFLLKKYGQLPNKENYLVLFRAVVLISSEKKLERFRTMSYYLNISLHYCKLPSRHVRFRDACSCVNISFLYLLHCTPPDIILPSSRANQRILKPSKKEIFVTFFFFPQNNVFVCNFLSLPQTQCGNL